MPDNAATLRAETSPSKEFFVNMLTRDIDLKDALLDLLDNCLDGVVRHLNGAAPDNQDRPYEGYHAKISLSADLFEIFDNCGGIPIDVAVKSAFAIGRRVDSITSQQGGATVGMYGIGMKRAIFKMGENAVVETLSDKHYDVKIGGEWLSSETWGELPINLTDKSGWELDEHGTRIKVTKLRQEVAQQFGSNKWFEDFRNQVARHYALIISKGFKVYIGRPEDILNELESTKVSPEDFLLLTNPAIAIEPIVYHGTFNDVNFEIFAGLTTQPLGKDEIAEGITDTTGKYRKNRSGWTIACNDRIVVWQDQTNLTGWGTGGVPSYHNQYTPIAGIVLLHSDSPTNLPLTTTKRGIDASSEIYARILDLMREATKELTSFTNNYKNAESRKPIFEESIPIKLEGLKDIKLTLEATESYSTMRAASVKGVKKYLKPYPKLKKVTTDKRISYTVGKEEFEIVKSFLGLSDPSPKNIGKNTFERTLKVAKEFEE